MDIFERFVDYMRDVLYFSDIEIAIVLYCINEDYTDVYEALADNGYDEGDPDTFEEAASSLTDSYYPNSNDSNDYEVNGTYYYIFDDYDDALEYAKKFIADYEVPEIYNYEDYRNYIDSEFFDDLYNEETENYANELLSESDGIYGNALVRDLYEDGYLDDTDFEEDEDGDPNYEECTQTADYLVELYLDNHNTEDSIEWYLNNFGTDAFNETVSYHNLFDADDYADDVTRYDGAAATLARYDGKERNYDYDGVTYYIYRQ